MSDTSHIGTFAEYVSLPQQVIALKPNNVTHNEAASMPLAGLTSFQALFHYGQLQLGQKVLILGGSGGTGSIAVQLAHAAGAYVAATCSTKNVELVVFA